MHAAGIELSFAEMKDPIKDKLKKFGLFSRLGGEKSLFATLGAAVDRYIAVHSIEWTDWDEQTP